MCDGLLGFLDLVEHIAPHVLSEIVSRINTSTTEPNYVARLCGGSMERRTMKRLLDLCRRSTGDVVQMAERLRNRFPSMK